MRFLVISLCFCLTACASYPKKNNFQKLDTQGTISNPYFSNLNQDYIYKANIEVYNRSLGGLFVVKKIGDQHHRIGFTTEMGQTLLDVTFYKDDFKVNYIVDELNKKMLIAILKTDFKVLITENLLATDIYSFENQIIKKAILDNKTYYYSEDTKTLKIIRANKRKEKVRFLFSEISDNIAQQIEINHSNIKLKINLKSIIKQN